MKLEAPANDNYAAVVVRIKAVTPLENCDNVVGTPILGFQAIVGKDTEVGTPGIVFPAETQLSDRFCHENNLYRHQEKNDDASKAGYIEDSRRVKAMKFRGHRSDCLFMPLESLRFTGAKLSDLKEGDVFDQLEGIEICKKYLVREPRPYNRLEKNKRFVRVDSKFLPEHYDSENFFRNRDSIPLGMEVFVTQKLHGTSIRIGNTVVQCELNLVERILKRLGVRIQETSYDMVYGSRKVVKDANNPNQNHFYSTDIWTEEGKKLDGIIPEGFVFYGELIGWTKDGDPIQKNYTYNLPVGQAELYVYRIAQVNPQGRVTDLTWNQTVELCKDLGLKWVPELWRGLIDDLVIEDFIDKAFHVPYSARPYEAFAVPLSHAYTVDEGVCVRVDGLAPYILKAKSPIFLAHETKMLDDEVIDLEVIGSDDQPDGDSVGSGTV